MKARLYPICFTLILFWGCDDSRNKQLPWTGDLPPITVEAGLSFLSSCNNDLDCSSGHCLSFGETKRCSRTCSDVVSCPKFTGWDCENSVCVCVPSDKQPNICNIDGDCDGQPDKTPSTEICNGEDDDCNDEVDDVAPSTNGAKKYFRDEDGDGYGDDSKIKWLCKPQTGWVERGGDCQDERKQDNPEAVEVCGDIYDNDCDNEKDDRDVCGLPPIVVPDVAQSSPAAGVLQDCSQGATPDASLDITKILAKQDTSAIKFTITLSGAPATDTCSSYTLHLGDPKGDFTMVYIYRPAVNHCGTLDMLERWLKGEKLQSSATPGFLAASPGHISFTIPKAEIYPNLPSPTYKIKFCTNATADEKLDLTACSADICETLVKR